MSLQLQSLGVNTCGYIPPAQLCQRTVDGTYGFAPVHGRDLHHDLGSGQ